MLQYFFRILFSSLWCAVIGFVAGIVHRVLFDTFCIWTCSMPYFILIFYLPRFGCHSISLGVCNVSLALYGLEPDLVGISWQTKSVASSCQTSSRNMSLHVYRTLSIRLLSGLERCNPTLSFNDTNQAVTSASGVVSLIVLRASQGLRLVGNPIKDPNASSFSSSESDCPTKPISVSLAASPLDK